MVKGNAAIEVFMKDKFIFPYDYLEEAKNELEVENKYNVYFVLKGHRLILRNLQVVDEYNFYIEIFDVANCNVINMPINIFVFLQLPSIKCVEINIVNNSSILQVDFTDMGMRYLNMYKPEFVERNKEFIEKIGHMRFQFHSQTLKDLFWEWRNKETVDEYELLYVGRTHNDTIYERLYNHTTIPKIIRCLNKKDQNDKNEIYVMVTGVHAKLYKEYNFENYSTNIITSNTLQDEFAINKGQIAREETVDIAEAMLILFFKPEYNTILKNTKKPELLETYRIFNECLINPITYSLDLYFEEIKNKIVLKTDVECTEYKLNILKCEFDSKGKVDSIKLEHYMEDLYL